MTKKNLDVIRKMQDEFTSLSQALNKVQKNLQEHEALLCSYDESLDREGFTQLQIRSFKAAIPGMMAQLEFIELVMDHGPKGSISWSKLRN
ncbi:MAG: hypothetical protein ABW104_13825 [Candidatus Thiodiazotropha sp. 6PLUC2]